MLFIVLLLRPVHRAREGHFNRDNGTVSLSGVESLRCRRDFRSFLGIYTPDKMFEDCLTAVDIPLCNLVTVYEGRTPYYFDIDSLARHYAASGRLENPYTQLALDAELGQRIHKHLDPNVVTFYVNYDQEIYIDKQIPLGFALVKIVTTLQSIESVSRVDVMHGGNSMYSRDLHQPVEGLGGKRIDCVISTPATPSNLRKLLQFLEGYTQIRSVQIVQAIVYGELHYGSCVKV
jgi:hypothetical protein